MLIRNSAAAPIAAMASYDGVPSMNFPGPASGTGRTLYARRRSSSDGSIHVIPACGPYHLYELVEYTSQPMAARSTGAWGGRGTPSITTLAPAAWAVAVIAVMSGIVPIAFEAPVTATQRVPSVRASAIAVT